MSRSGAAPVAEPPKRLLKSIAERVRKVASAAASRLAGALKTATAQASAAPVTPASAAPASAAPASPARRKSARRKAAPRKAAPRKSARRKAAPRKAASRKAAPRKAAPRRVVPRRVVPRTVSPAPVPSAVAVAPRTVAPAPVSPAAAVQASAAPVPPAAAVAPRTVAPAPLPTPPLPPPPQVAAAVPAGTTVAAQAAAAELKIRAEATSRARGQVLESERPVIKTDEMTPALYKAAKNIARERVKEAHRRAREVSSAENSALGEQRIQEWLAQPLVSPGDTTANPPPLHSFQPPAPMPNTPPAAALAQAPAAQVPTPLPVAPPVATVPAVEPVSAAPAAQVSTPSTPSVAPTVATVPAVDPVPAAQVSTPSTPSVATSAGPLSESVFVEKAGILDVKGGKIIVTVDEHKKIAFELQGEVTTTLKISRVDDNGKPIPDAFDIVKFKDGKVVEATEPRDREGKIVGKSQLVDMKSYQLQLRGVKDTEVGDIRTPDKMVKHLAGGGITVTVSSTFSPDVTPVPRVSGRSVAKPAGRVGK